MFQYQPLARDNIRLFVLLPGDRLSPLCGSMFHINLLDSRYEHPYKTLSYTWGNSSLTATVRLRSLDGSNSGEIKITRDLAVALEHLRSPELPLKLWVDQLSIDQSNVREKEILIPLMRRIYESSEEVLAWLGPGADDSDLAMDIIARTDWQQFFNRVHDAFSAGSRPVPIEYLIYPLHQLQKRPWWTRTWILQEATALNPSKTLIICGRKQVSLAKLLSFGSTDPKMQRGMDSTPIAKLWLIMGEMYFRIDIFQRLTNQPSGKMPPLFELINRTTGTKTSDPRDKIYSMVGFSKEYCETGDPLKINYACPPFEVYVSCALWHISHYKSLDLFAYCTISPVALDTEPPIETAATGTRSDNLLPTSKNTCMKNLPTWTPSWARGKNPLMKSKMEGQNPVYSFQASGCFNSVRCDVHKKPSLPVVHLSLLGVKVSVISVVKENGWSIPDINSCYSYGTIEFIEKMQKWAPEDIDRICPLTGQRMDWVFGYTVRALSLGPGNVQNGVQLNDKAPNQVDRMGLEEFDGWSDIIRIHNICRSRCLFCTSPGLDGTPGLMGLGPREVKSGDEVWILQGSGTPIVLRPRLVEQDCTYGSMDLETGFGENHFVAAGETLYQLVGEGFIYGLMDGEVIDMLGSSPKRPRPVPLAEMDIEFRKIGLI